MHPDQSLRARCIDQALAAGQTEPTRVVQAAAMFEQFVRNGRPDVVSTARTTA